MAMHMPLAVLVRICTKTLENTTFCNPFRIALTDISNLRQHCKIVCNIEYRRAGKLADNRDVFPYNVRVVTGALPSWLPIAKPEANGTLALQSVEVALPDGRASDTKG